MGPLFSAKNIGIIISILSLASVGGVTVVKEHKSTPQAVVATSQVSSSNTVSNTTKTSTSIASTVKTTPTITPKVTKTIRSSRESEESGESSEGGDDDGGGSRTSTPTPVPTPVVVTTPPPATVPKQTASVYKDGTYTAVGSYNSPAGYEQISITLTLKNDIITSVSATNMAQDGTSSYYQDQFISGYSSYVVGQNIDNVNLSVVSGSSLTPIGFNDALSQIKTQAKA